PYAIDDAWITYRYAENLANGLGMVYNPGEHVLGTSTPLYTLILAILHVFGAPVPASSQAIGFVAMLGTLGGIFLLTKRVHSEPAALLAAGLVVSMGSFNQVVAQGMETPLYVCLIVFSFYFFATDSLYLFAVLAALCALTRLDGLGVGIAGFATYWLIRRRLPGKAVALYVACLLPWALFSYYYFGSISPNALIAKQVHNDYRITFWIIDWLSGQPLTPFAIVGAGAMIAAPLTRKVGLLLVTWLLGYVTAYSLARISFYAWYVTPLTAALAILAAVGILTILKTVFHGRAIQGILLAVLIIFLVLPDFRLVQRRLRGDVGIEKADQVRYDAAHWLRDNLPRSAVIVSGGIGQVGYFTQNYILDASGLVSPQVITDIPWTWPRFLPFIIEHYRPEYVFEAFPDVPDYMKDDYSIVRTWEVGDSFFQRFYLFRRTGTDSIERDNSVGGLAK
ncbi:MAG: hypothetical protein ACM3S0_08120, partial [Acidobacteriota bacterium]